jgi:hypothetical protein
MRFDFVLLIKVGFIFCFGRGTPITKMGQVTILFFGFFEEALNFLGGGGVYDFGIWGSNINFLNLNFQIL